MYGDDKKIEMKRCYAYDVTTRTKKEVVVQENPCYGRIGSSVK